MATDGSERTRADQRAAFARAQAEAAGGVSLLDTRDLLLFVVIGPNGEAQWGGTTDDWAWVAATLRKIADLADSRAGEGRDV